jgi:ABC-2 type transport system permease protein
MSAPTVRVEIRGSVLLDELAKLPAFLRRDVVVALSYRMAFVTEWIGLGVQTLLFYFLGRMVNPAVLPAYGGTRASYLEFAVVGIAVGAFVTLALARVAAGIRNEQMAGTLESLLMTPTAPTTVQLGTVFYDLLYIPLRTAAFLVLTALVFGLDFHTSGFVPALTILLAFIPFVWGLGVLNAGLILTFRRGAGIAGFAATMLTLASGAFFPLTPLPSWLQSIAELNPLAIAIDGMRGALIGNSGWSDAGVAIAKLAPFASISVVVGFWIFGLALRRERRLGTLGLY